MQCGKDKHARGCDGPKICSNCNGSHTSSAKDCPVWQKEKEIQRVRVEKRISFPEARQLVEAKMTPILLKTLSFPKVVSDMNSTRTTGRVECQTDLTWLSSGGPVMSVSNKTKVASAGTQTSSEKHGSPLKETNQEGKSGSPCIGPSVPSKRQPSTTGAGSKAASKPQVGVSDEAQIGLLGKDAGGGSVAGC